MFNPYIPVLDRAEYPTFESKSIIGKVNLTSDVWQASNADGYFTVTGHWIKEKSSGLCEIGFHQDGYSTQWEAIRAGPFNICIHPDIIIKV